VIRHFPAAARGQIAGEVVWDGRDESGTPVASGHYIARLRAADGWHTQKLVLVK